MNITHNGITITLTDDQVKQIEAQQRKTIPITERIKTVEDAFREAGIPLVRRDKETDDEFSYRLLKVVIKALNEGWEPDWNNSYQKKWYPYFNMKSGFGFSASGCDAWRAYMDAGARLCIKSEELATYAGKQFESLYKSFLTTTP